MVIPMYDELVKNLRYDSASALQNCEFDFVHAWMLEAADAIEELQKQLDNAEIENIKLKEDFAKYRKKYWWIPVTVRLPENDVPVLLSCKCGAGAYICDGFHTEKYSTPIPFYADIDADYNEEADEYYFPEGWWEIIKNWDDHSCVAIEDTITHWMPLPQPPKDGEP